MIVGDSPLATRYHEVVQQVRQATPAGRDVTLVVVTKFHPVELNRELFALGQRDFGESRHQEAREKVDDPELRGAIRHFIGQLQSNKARQVARYADVIHSLDRPSLLKALTGLDRPTPLGVFLQLNLTGDEGRGGVEPAQLLPLAEEVLATPNLSLLGVMGVPGVDAEPARAFAELRGYSERLRTVAPSADRISAGMSHDWREALQEGATHLRIGTSITGKRAY